MREIGPSRLLGEGGGGRGIMLFKLRFFFSKKKFELRSL